MFPHTAAAWARLKFNARALACEVLFRWAQAVCPAGYVPSYTQIILDAYNRRGRFSS